MRKRNDTDDRNREKGEIAYEKSHNIKGIILAVVMLLLIVGYYYYLSNRNVSQAEDADRRTADRLSGYAGSADKRSGDKLSADTERGRKIFQPDHTMLLQ